MTDEPTPDPAPASAWSRLRSALDNVPRPTLPKWWRAKSEGASRRAVRARTPTALIVTVFVWGAAAGFTEALFMALFVLRQVGDIAWRYDFTWASATHQPPAETFDVALRVHPLLFVLMALAGVVIVGWSMFWIPVYRGLRGAGRMVVASCVIVGLFCNLLTLAGGAHGMNTNNLEDLRDEIVQQRGVDSAVGDAEARRDAIRRQLEDLKGGDDVASPSYQMQACRAGAASWAERERRARAAADPRADLIDRSAPDAARCDDLRHQIDVAENDIAAARRTAAETVTVRNVAAERNRIDDQFMSTVDTWRPYGMSLGLSLIAICATMWGFALRERRALYVEDEPAPTLDWAAIPLFGAYPVDWPAMPLFWSPGEKPDEPAAPDEDALALPRLDDWRDAPDPAFEALALTVDQDGRLQRRVRDHFRTDDKAAPASGADPRRTAPVEPPGDRPADPAVEPPGEPQDGDEPLQQDMFGAPGEPAPAPSGDDDDQGEPAPSFDALFDTLAQPKESAE